MKVLIVDDEPLAIEELKYLVGQHPQVTQVDQADDAASTLKAVNDHHYDVLFLDIHLGDEDGVKLGKTISQFTNAPQIIFATAYDQYALAAFDAHATDYILKPYEEARVYEALDRVATSQSESNPATDNLQRPWLAITAEDRTDVIQKATIIMAEVTGNEVVITTTDGTFYSKQSLAKLELELDHEVFMRVHRNYLVNLTMVSEAEPGFNHNYQLTLRTGQKVPVSRSYVGSVKTALGI